MTHELFGMPARMHDVMNLALLDAALILALPLVLVAMLRWSRKREARKSAHAPLTRGHRKRRARPNRDTCPDSARASK